MEIWDTYEDDDAELTGGKQQVHPVFDLSVLHVVSR